MISEFGVFDIIIIVGAIQGAVGAGFVGTYPSNSPNKKLLSAILITLSLFNFKIIIPIIGFNGYPALQYFPLATDTLIQPLIYLYTCSLTEKNFALSKRKLWHFLPGLLFQFYVIIVYVMTVMEVDFHIKYTIAVRYFFYNTVKLIENIVALFSAAIYWYLSFRKTARYRQWLFMNQSSTRYSELTWLRNLLIGTGILGGVLFLSSMPVSVLGLADSLLYVKILYSYFTILIYFLTFRGYQMLLISEVQVLPLSEVALSKHIAFIDYSDVAREISDFDDNFSKIQSALVEVMEKRQLFMEPELSLKEISKIIGFPAGQVSSAINAGFGKNFRTWVNSYRVEEVKKRLDDPRYKHLNLTGIAFDCGFNSEASFYRIFRQYTGYSPKTFMQSIKTGD